MVTAQWGDVPVALIVRCSLLISSALLAMTAPSSAFFCSKRRRISTSVKRRTDDEDFLQGALAESPLSTADAPCFCRWAAAYERARGRQGKRRRTHRRSDPPGNAVQRFGCVASHGAVNISRATFRGGNTDEMRLSSRCCWRPKGEQCQSAP